jgi:L,D-peptidoglycan transpeptidase YkuD (ErfK/YbiS/YcfS/YnhG family)
MSLRTAPKTALLAAGLLLVTGCATTASAGTHPAPDGRTATRAGATDHSAGHAAPSAADRSGLRTLPGSGRRTAGAIPADAREAVLVTGGTRDSDTASMRVYERPGAGAGWSVLTPSWPAHNGLHGWSTHHMVDDLRTPDGVFALTDAGGRLADPGTGLPYTRAAAFTDPGTGFDGESLADAFDYVVAIDYNREPGTSPLNGTKPLGAARGGGIWIHVDHGGPTQGCVSVPLDDMRELLRLLDPARHPVVVMGSAAWLSR